MDLPELAGIDREVSLTELLTQAYQPHAQSAADVGAAGLGEGFWLERLRFALEQRGNPIEVVRGATASGDIIPLRTKRVAAALQRTRTSEDFQSLAVLFKRVKNIARELKARGPLAPQALSEPAEQALVAELDARRPRVEQAVRVADYRQALTEIAALAPVVDRFFTEVFVMADDERLRTARLTLMADLRDLVLDLADISEIIPRTE